MEERTQAGRLTITTEDLQSANVQEHVQRMKSAQSVPLTQPIGAPKAPPPNPGKWWYDTIVTTGIAGLLGGLLGWIISEVISRPDSENAPFADNPALATTLFTVLFAVGLAGVLASWEGFQSRSVQKAGLALMRSAPVVIAGAAIGGFVAQKVIYQPMVEDLFVRAFREASSEQQFFDIVASGLHLPRGIGFAVMGAMVGLALGAATRSGRRAVNGLVGALVGGFLGGFVFDYVAEWFGNSGMAGRIAALGITGLMTGLAIGLVENIRKEFWLEIMSGGMAGKQFILYHDRTIVGSAPDCHVTLIKDSAIAQRHMTLARTSRGLELQTLSASNDTLVNGSPVHQTQLRDGDVLQVGTTLLRFGEKQPSIPIVRGIAPGAV
jgi:hypothetical protein